LVVAVCILAGLSSEAAAEPSVYVGEERYNRSEHFPFRPASHAYLTRVDTVTRRQLSQVWLAQSSSVCCVYIGDVVVSPDGSHVYVSTKTETLSSVFVVDAATMTKTATISIPEIPLGMMAISPDGASLYVGTLSSLVVIDTASSTIRDTVPLTGKAQTVVLSSTGARAYVTVSPSATTAGLLAVVDTSSLTVSSTVTVGMDPYGLALSPSGSTAYVGNLVGRSVSVVDTASGTVTSELSLPAVADNTGAVLGPEDLVMTVDGSVLYIKYRAAVLRFDVTHATFTTVRPTKGDYRGRPELTPGSDHVYVPVHRTGQALSFGVFVNWYYDDVDVLPAGDADVERVFTFANPTINIWGTYDQHTAALAFPPATGCLFEVTDRDLHVDAAGGTGILTIPAPAGCTWTLDASAATFVTFTSPTSGTGPGTLSFSVPAYTGTLLRQDVVSVNSQDVRFSQIVSAVTIDRFNDGSGMSNIVRLTGWAVDPDPSLTSGTGVDAVHVWAYPDPGSGANPIFLGAAQYGLDRIDVLRLGYPGRFVRSGFSLATTLAIGRYQIVAFAHRTRTGDFSLVKPVTVDVKPAATIDAPHGNATVSFPFNIGGWAFDPSTPGAAGGSTGVSKVEILATPASGGSTIVLGTAAYGKDRADVAAVWGTDFRFSGFDFTARPQGGAGFTTGVWRIGLRLTTNYGDTIEPEPTTVTIVKQRQITIDTPTNGDVGGTPFTIAGWAIDVDAPSGTGIDAIHVWAWPTSGAAPRFLGVATPGIARPDIASLFGSQFNAAGFSLVVTDLPAGDYTLVAYAHSTTTGQFDQAHAIVFHCSGAGFPAMYVDAPAAGATVPASTLLEGWAIDGRAADGIGIDAIHVWGFPINGGSPVFAGVGTLRLSRPDIAQAFGSRYAYAGFSRSLTALPPGTYDVAVYAHSAVTGQFDQHRVVRVTIQP
jgi:DNA-binding beta-propeller fold protein YncE